MKGYFYIVPAFAVWWHSVACQIQQNPTANDAASPMVTYRLEQTQTVTFTAHLMIGMKNSDDGGNIVFIPASDLYVQAARPASLHIVAKRDSRREASGKNGFAFFPFDTFISNGLKQLELDSPFHEYFLTNSATVLADIKGASDVPAFINPDVLFGNKVLSKFKLQKNGPERIDGTPVAMYSQEFTVQGEPFRYDLYLACDTGLPVQISYFVRDSGGKMVEKVRTTYSDWKLDEPIPTTAFDVTPPRDAKPYDLTTKPDFDPALKPGMPAGALATTTLDKQPITLKQYAGKVVLLDYWATWCGPCLADLPNVSALYAKFHKDGLEVISISLDDKNTVAKLPDAIKEHHMTWPQICDEKGFDSPLATAYKVAAIPFALLIGKDGKIVAVNAHGKELEAAVRKALQQP